MCARRWKLQRRRISVAEEKELEVVEASGEMSLEARLERLEEIVGKLEADELELEAALALFEEGIRHAREAERILAAAQLRVEELVGEGDEMRTEPFEEEQE